MSFTNTYETHVLNYLFTATSVTRPVASNLHLALFTADPTETGSTSSELSGSGYTRKAVAFTVSGNLATNSGAIEFPTATGSWGTVSHVAVMDASSSGNMLASSALSVSKAVNTGDVLRINAGELDITLD